MKTRSMVILLVSQVASMSVWFVSAAVLPQLIQEIPLSTMQQAALSSGVQLGFVVGALGSAVLGLADRYDPRRFFAVSAIGAGLSNAVLLVVSPDSAIAVVARFVTGALLAGVYPVGMKIAIGWGQKDRGLLVGALVGALTLGSASPHLISWLGGEDWRMTVAIVSVASVVSGLLCLAVKLGPYHATSPEFDFGVIREAWTNRRVRLAYIGYLGHMWELFAMWAWISAATAVSYSQTLAQANAEAFAKLTAFVAIASGGVACLFAGWLADRIGKAEVTIIAMVLSGSAAIAMALTFGGPVWLTFLIVIFWGITVIPDSAQFSALVADASRPDQAGSLMTLQTALGFALTFLTVQLTPSVAAAVGWPIVLASLAIGPIVGVIAMSRLKALE